MFGFGCVSYSEEAYVDVSAVVPVLKRVGSFSQLLFDIYSVEDGRDHRRITNYTCNRRKARRYPLFRS